MTIDMPFWIVVSAFPSQIIKAIVWIQSAPITCPIYGHLCP